MGLFGLGSSNAGIIGLDIGADSIKATELQASRDNYQLVSFGMIPLPPGTTQNGEIVNFNDLNLALRDLKKNSKFNTTNVALGLSGSNVIVKNIVVPYMEREELEHSLYWEAEQHIPMDVNECNISFDILGQPNEADGQMDVLIAAAKKDFVQRYIEAIADAGFKAKIMDVSSIALENMYLSNYPANPQHSVILADIGAHQINLSVIDGNIGVFNRDIDLGGVQYTEEIRNQLGVTFEEAENLKIGGNHNADVPMEVKDIIASVSQSFASEIQRSLDFYLASASDSPVAGIYLAGGGSLTMGLAQVIQDRTSFPVEVLNPFSRIEYSEKQFSSETIYSIGPLAAVSVGLALRSKE